MPGRFGLSSSWARVLAPLLLAGLVAGARGPAVLAFLGDGDGNGKSDDSKDKDKGKDGKHGPRFGFKELSDQDRDGDVDLDDLKKFSSDKLESDYTKVDWEAWVASEGEKWSKHYSRLVAFVVEYYGIDSPVDPLAVVNRLVAPSRLALGPDACLLVSDPSVGSVFRLDSRLGLSAEYKGFDCPVGIVADSVGNLYVGDDGTDRIEKVGPGGNLISTFGADLVSRPVDLAMDSEGSVYVADADAGVVWVFSGDGAHLRTIRRGGLLEPVALEIARRTDSNGATVEEVYVLDKAAFAVRVYDLQGAHLRTIGGFPPKSGGRMGMSGTFTVDGYFVGPQSLLVDASGKLDVLDLGQSRVQVLDAVSGKYVEAFGKVGSGTGEFRTPVDIALDSSGKVVVADPGNRRVEVLR